MNPFKPGDVVQLRSGGPAMTVSEAIGGSVTCIWFQEHAGSAYVSPPSWGEPKSRTIQAAALELVRR